MGWLLCALAVVAEASLGEGSGISSYFTVDTRFSGSAGEDSSGLFTVDTLGATTGTAVIAGRVTDSGSMGLSGATVSALLNSVIRAQAGTDASGYFTLSALPAGTYDVRAQKANYLSAIGYGFAVDNGQTLSLNFLLTAMPGAPVVVQTNRTPDAPVTIANSQLKRFVGGNWVTVTSTNDVDRAKQTVVMTHGWNSSAQGWPSNTAAKMIAGGVTDANVLAWDWRTNADTGLLLSLAYSRTPGEGRKLAQTLVTLLGTNYTNGIHFIGHSLGTLVNASAANYLHTKTSSAFDWRRTQMTLLDNAELANVEGRLLPVGYTVAGFESLLGRSDAPPLGWVSPLPEQRQWSDNYISLVGLYHLSVVNAWLPKGIAYGAQINPVGWASEAHGYACQWYADTAQNVNLSILGNRYSFERLGVNAQFPSPSPYLAGSLFTQYNADDYALINVADVPGYIAQSAAEFAKSKLLDGLNWLTRTGEKVGDAIVDVVESGVAVLEDTTQAIVSQPIISLQAVLRSAGGAVLTAKSGISLAARNGPLGDSGDYTNSPSAVWLPVQIPTNAALFSFDFTFTGDGGQDVLSASINGTNVFALEAQDMPEGQLLNSGPIVVTQWRGQTVELFFGLLGGTSTNATITIAGMRFYQIDPPLVAAELTGTNIVISWPATVTGYALESAGSLTSSPWGAVTNVPALSGMRQYVTNSVSGESRFYRLRKN